VRGARSAERRAGSALYHAAFAEFREPFFRQELLAALVAHIGSGAPLEADAALTLLAGLARADAAAVRAHAAYVRGVLDHAAALPEPLARVAYAAFAALGGPELRILVRKQMTAPAADTRRRGVIGAVALLQARARPVRPALWC
jgi:hypothetical protein